MITVRRVAEWAQEHLGLLWEPSTASEIRLKLVMAAREHGFEDVDVFVEHVFNDLTPVDRRRLLASVLTIGETYFFREPEMLESFKEEVLPKILRYRSECGQRRLRLWSAGCSTGEEAYTLAMILKEALHERLEWDFSIVATDINEKALETAREGIYRPRSFRNPLPAAYSKYLMRLEEGNLWRVSDDVKRHTTFCVLNLAADGYPSPVTQTTDVDAVFCRNVIMYFDPKTRAAVLQRFHRALNGSGWLVLGASETHTASSGPWESVCYPRAIFLRKRHEPVSHGLEAFNTTTAAATLPPAQSLMPGSVPESPARHAGRMPRIAPSGSPRGFLRPHEKTMRTSSRREGGPPDAVMPAEGPIAGEVSAATDVSHGTTSPEASRDEDISRLVSSGRLDEAVVRVEEQLVSAAAGTRNEELRDAVRRIVHALAAEKRSEKALDLLDRALAFSKFDPTYHHMKGALHAERGETEKAVAAFRQMLYVAPQSATALLSLGMLCGRDGHGEAARRYLEGALQLLRGKDERELVPHSDGMSVGQTRRIIEQFLEGTAETPREGA